MKENIQSQRITTFVCFDIETTGLSPARDKIIEIGAIKVREGKIIGYFSEFINPQMKLPANIIQLTGIKDEMLMNSETEDNIIKRFIEFTEDYTVIGHNILFDYSFIKTAAMKQHMVFEKMGIDTLEISRKLLTCLESKSLENVCRYYNIMNDHAHRAYEDAKATVMLYVNLCNDFYWNIPEAFIPKPLWYKVK